MRNYSTSKYTTGKLTGITCTRLNKDSVITKILEYIDKNLKVSGYDIRTNVLGMKGTSYELRGKHSSLFCDLRDIGIITSNKGYSLTEKGKAVLKDAKAK